MFTVILLKIQKPRGVHVCNDNFDIGYKMKFLLTTRIKDVNWTFSRNVDV